MTTLSPRAARTLEELHPYIEQARAFSGWSFGAERVRRIEPGEPWDYEAVARDYAANASRILDLGTGGGEVLSRVLTGLPARCVATEEWHVNAPVARDRLRPLGIGVVRASSLRLPFADASFDLILDRHEELSPAECARVLAPGGAVVTQQCGPDNWREFHDFFPRATVFEDHECTYPEGFVAAGFTIARREHREYRVAFRSLGDVAYMLMTAPWTVPDFDPERDIDALLALEDALTTDDGIVMTETRYLLIAHKPAS
jgi:SAM-dependent methyltransferase